MKKIRLKIQGGIIVVWNTSGIIVVWNTNESFFSSCQWGQDLFNCCRAYPSASSLTLCE